MSDAGPAPRSLPPPDRRRQHQILVGAVLVALAVVAALLVIHRRNAPSDRGDFVYAPPNVAFSDLPAYEGSTFADAMQRDQRRFTGQLRRDPVTYLATDDFTSPSTNVTGHARATRAPTCPGCRAAVLWLVGGSTAFGLGQRDDHTIASGLVRLAEADGIALTVENLALPGWTLRDERRAVESRLAGGAPDPDLLVSFGGYNDSAGGLVALAVDGEASSSNELDAATVESFVRRGLSSADAGGVDKVADTVAARYRSEREQLQALTRARGIRTWFFFQPDALADPVQRAPVEGINRGLPASTADDLAAVLEAVSTRLAPSVVDERHLYDDEPTSLFVDWAHTNERGATLAARAIYRRLATDLRAVAR